MRKRVGIIGIVMLMIFLVVGCSEGKTAVYSGRMSVVVSFNAMGEFAGAIGKDKVDIYTVVPNGTEPHDFEPKARDLMKISDAKVFIYNGLGVEAWAEQVLDTINSKKLIAVDASSGAELILNNQNSEEKGQYDPHIWISLKEARVECNNIRLAFVKADPKNKDYYEENYRSYIGKLDSLYSKYETRIKSLKNKKFVTGHAAFAYLCRDFGLTQNSVEDVFAEGEPSALKLKGLVDYCLANNIKTIFSESMVSPRISQTLATEVRAKVETIYTLESKEDGKDYITSMKDNLEKIYASLSK